MTCHCCADAGAAENFIGDSSSVWRKRQSRRRCAFHNGDDSVGSTAGGGRMMGKRRRCDAIELVVMDQFGGGGDGE